MHQPESHKIAPSVSRPHGCPVRPNEPSIVVCASLIFTITHHNAGRNMLLTSRPGRDFMRPDANSAHISHTPALTRVLRGRRKMRIRAPPDRNGAVPKGFCARAPCVEHQPHNEYAHSSIAFVVCHVIIIVCMRGTEGGSGIGIPSVHAFNIQSTGMARFVC